MSRGLVGNRIGAVAGVGFRFFGDFRKEVGGVAQKSDRDRFSFGVGFLDDIERLIQTVRLGVEVLCIKTELYGRRSAFDGKKRRTGHGRRQRLGRAHTAEPAGKKPLARQITAKMLPAHFRECLVGALDDALGADVNPGTRRHLAIHGQTFLIQFVKGIPVGPGGNDV